jgi:arsenate reductase (glutaredoxin)
MRAIGGGSSDSILVILSDMKTPSNETSGNESPLGIPTAEGEVLLLHNPGCSKSRATKAVLEQAGISFGVRLYMEDPLTEDELAVVAARLDRPVREWVRSGQAEYALAGLDANAGSEAFFAAMAKDPILMERPIVLTATGARIGRPPIHVLELFQS